MTLTLDRHLTDLIPEKIDREPILQAMEAWLTGKEKVPSCAEFIDRFGKQFTGGIWDLKFDDGDYLRTMERHRAIERFGFVIPSLELLRALKAHEPIIEIGAGSGYLTQLARNEGISVIGTDKQDGEKYGFQTGQCDPEQKKMSALAAVRKYPSCTVFCAWPSLGKRWLRSALKEMQPGRKAIIIEEDCCAEKSTWNYRDKNFDKVQSIPIPRWPYIRDYAAVWRKK